MGVLGLWRLLDPAGKPTAVETLEGKVLAIDVSIWIHQVLQGYKDGKGDSVQNAHLLGLFNRICKLLYFKIKPVFVFDGGVPVLKKNTIAARRKLKSIAGNKAKNLQQKLMSNLVKRFALSDASDKKAVQKQSTSSVEPESTVAIPFELNPLYTETAQPSTSKIELNDYDFDSESDFDSSEESSPTKQSKWIGNIHSVNIDTEEFKSLPADVRYDILTDLKDTRKQNSWGRIHEMPPVLNDFSTYQMNRLLKRRHVQESLEKAEKEIGGSKTLTLEELDKLLTEQGIETSDYDNKGLRVASDSSSRVIFVNDKNIYQQTTDNITGNISIHDVNVQEENASNSSEKMSSSHDEFKEISSPESKYENDESDDSDSDVSIGLTLNSKKSSQSNKAMEKVKKYMLESTCLTEEEFLNFIKQSRKKNSKAKKKKKKFPLKSVKEKVKASVNEVKNIELDNVNTKINQQETIDVREEILPDSEHFCEEKEENVSTSISNTIEFSKEVTEEKSKSSFVQNQSGSNDSDNEFITVDCKRELDKNNVIEISNEAIFKKVVKTDEGANDSNVQEISSENSDSDDFIEVDNSIFETISTFNEVKDNFDIVVKPVRNLENDMFADIFTEEAKESESTSLKKLEKLESTIMSEEKNEDICSDKKGEGNSESKNISYHAAPLKENVDTDVSSKIPFGSSERNPSLAFAEADISATLGILDNERMELSEEIGKLERQAVNVTEQMSMEAQELLRLFGIPYIVAPMEAEAQCAFLEQINLTDGTITDDSDIWLFGAKCVYKNFFNNNKTVLQFRSCDIQHHFKLARQQLIQIALLVGSDYTSGLKGVGPVTAMEILSTFPAEGENLLQGLTKFSDWFKSGKISESSLRNKLKNLQISEGFPSQAVVQAYLFPTVDESKENFTWRKPNLNLLFDHARRKFGWTKLKFEEKINPIMKKLAEKRSQKGIDAYFQMRTTPKNIKQNLSKRLQSAVSRMELESVEENERKNSDEADSLLLVKELGEQERLENISKNKGNSSKLKSPATKGKKAQSTDVTVDKKHEEYIPQRESSRIKAEKKKLHAIEVFSKSKKKSAAKKKNVRRTGKILKNADLSESSSSS
ncbi:DNA excision repair protein ERCC-5 [Leptopilina heterotoma]|uniref:DNA excision repair protein ERCC-5 n=1 Tax=Leptopilina heterotoma TaxID=63436 RepID=UPI001CA88573|nr:DNA excision repair protein ERCC-5 [Leptopilina heterotoma]XP_043464303.1 DNA excision repair protein ERCC-5 [Leptopilina heterotoma]XP_043464304.1 DNA excision repair protein ERCC-5 [Leptopilina heterotoma]